MQILFFQQMISIIAIINRCDTTGAHAGFVQKGPSSRPEEANEANEGGVVGPVAFKILKLLIVVGFNLILKVLKSSSRMILSDILAVIWDAGEVGGTNFQTEGSFSCR